MHTKGLGIIRHSGFLEHMPGPTHPEHPRRLKALYQMLEREFEGVFLDITPRPATVDELELVHTPFYIQKVLNTAQQEHTMLSPDTPVCNRSYHAAFLAVGAAICGAEEVSAGRVGSCFALVRPPGHHALPDAAMGFCIFNNIAVAAEYAYKRLGIGRILIIDWDVHMGNGISEIFYDKSHVFYFSTHRLELFPYVGDSTQLGKGDGIGTNLNIPLPPETTTEDFVSIYWLTLEEIIPIFRPELTIVAAGYDVHYMDPVGKLNVKEEAFYIITQVIRAHLNEIGSHKLLLVLEGGYDPIGLSLCVKETLKALIDPIQMPLIQPSSLAQGLIEEVMGKWRLNLPPTKPPCQ